MDPCEPDAPASPILLRSEATALTTTFSDLDLHADLVRAADDLGFAHPTPIQAALIPVLLSGRDAVGQAQTGTGKTAAFGFPLLHRITPGAGPVQGLVLVPTRELAVQVASELYKYGEARGVRVLPIYGGQAYHKQVSRLRKGVDVVVATPGRLLDLLSQGALDLGAVRGVVLDEADEMLSMGFVDDIERILEATSPERQTALLSATLPDRIRQLADRYLRDPEIIAIGAAQRTADTVDHRAYLVHGGDKLAALVRLLETEDVESALVFVHTRAATNEIASALSGYGYTAEALSGEMTQAARTETLDRFRARRIAVLVGTDVAARGLDIDHISHVVNVDLPRDPEVYVHRIGRTGRAGRSGTAISLVRPNQRRLLETIERYTKQEVPYATLPSAEEVQAHREAAFAATVAARASATSDADRALVLDLIAGGLDPMDIAAAALGLARAAEPAPPLPLIREVRAHARKERAAPSQRPSQGGRGSAPRSAQEDGMVRLAIDQGGRQGVRPGQVVSAIARHAEIPGKAIGKILIEDSHTLVDVPEALVGRVLGRPGGYRLGKRTATITKA